jgi:hypothetical protein
MFVLLLFKVNEIAELFYPSALDCFNPTPFLISSRCLAYIQAKAVP